MRSLLAIAFLGNLVVLGVSRATLPLQVASSFGAAGQANDLASRDHYLLLSLGLSIFVCLVFFVLSSVIAYLPASLINLPNKEYWLAPHRAAETYRKLTSMTALIGTATLAFMSAVQILIIVANHSQPPRLPMVPFVMVVVTLLLGIAVVTFYWLSEFMWRGVSDE